MAYPAHEALLEPVHDLSQLGTAGLAMIHLGPLLIFDLVNDDPPQGHGHYKLVLLKHTNPARERAL